jgi:hypothetical protein
MFDHHDQCKPVRRACSGESTPGAFDVELVHKLHDVSRGVMYAFRVPVAAASMLTRQADGSVRAMLRHVRCFG